MPTCPPFSSVGVPGPLAGRESAPSVALNIFNNTYEGNGKKNKKKKHREKKEQKRKIWFCLIFLLWKITFTSNTICFTPAQTLPKKKKWEFNQGFETKEQEKEVWKVVRNNMTKHTEHKVS